MLVIDYCWGSIWSNATATATTGGPRVIGVFNGNGAPSGPNDLLFSDVDRPSDALRDRSGVGWSHRPHAPVLGAPQRALDRKLERLGLQLRAVVRTCTDMYLSMEAPAHAVSALAHVY